VDRPFNVLTRSGRGEGNDVRQGGPTEGNGAIAMILHNVPEGGPASQTELGVESLQPSYSEERGTSIGMHHGPLGHFGVNKLFQSATASGLDAVNLREDIKEFIKFCPTCKKISYVRPIIYSIPYISNGSSRCTSYVSIRLGRSPG
jgi:hypothetical protein